MWKTSTVRVLDLSESLVSADRSQGAFCKFRECIDVATPMARHQVHTLDLKCVKPSLAFLSSEQASWLRKLLDSLPSLRALLIHHNPSVNHEVFTSILATSATPLDTERTQNTWHLRLLSMTEMVNVSPDDLAAALLCFPHLMYLDLSFSRVASNPRVIEQLRCARFILTLKILKLRGIGLRNDGLERIANVAGTGLWSLDVRQNNLTDTSARVLSNHCFLPPEYVTPPRYSTTTIEDTSDCAQDDQEACVLRRMADCKRDSGLTHLYISDNDISAAGIVDLVRASRLLVLDCGGRGGMRVYEGYKGSAADAARDSKILVQILSEVATDKYSSAGSLKYLRINHQLVTGDCAFLDTLDDKEAAKILRWRIRWPLWVQKDWQEAITDTAIPTMGLRTLVLTGIPQHSNTGWIAKGLQAFINQCASIEAAGTECAASPPYGADPQGAANPQSAVNPSSTTNPHAAADPPTAAESQITANPQTGAEPQSAANPETAATLPTTKTTLRKLYLEVDTPATDVGTFDMQEAIRNDFSFFDEAPQPPAERSSQPENNPWLGDVVEVLRKRKALSKHTWSGKIVVVRHLTQE